MAILSIISTFFGTLFKVGEDLSPAFNNWAEQVLIPSEERAAVNRRLRRCKWLLLHYLKMRTKDLVAVKFTDQTPAMQQSIVDFLNSEVAK